MILKYINTEREKISL